MARAIWSGVISFGLVTIPVRLVSAVRQQEVHFRQLHKLDGGRIQYRRLCEKEEREVAYQAPRPAPVVDLMEALQASVEQARERRKKSA